MFMSSLESFRNRGNRDNLALFFLHPPPGPTPLPASCRTTVLHRGYKVHPECLKNYWSERVSKCCRVTNITCPAEVTGCAETLSDLDLRGVVNKEELAAAEQKILEIDAQSQELIAELRQHTPSTGQQYQNHYTAFWRHFFVVVVGVEGSVLTMGCASNGHCRTCMIVELLTNMFAFVIFSSLAF